MAGRIDDGSSEAVVLQDSDPKLNELVADGYQVVARSHGAELDLTHMSEPALNPAIRRASFAVRELRNSDIPAVLELDQLTKNDYPGDVATIHDLLDSATASVDDTRRAFGAFVDNQLIAMMYIDLLTSSRAELDFWVVKPEYRGMGVATYLGVFALKVLTGLGITKIRTGSSADNIASARALQKLGFQIDETWLTLRKP